MKKKAVLGLSLTELMGVIFVIVLIFAAIRVGARLMGMLGDTKNADTVKNMNALSEQITKMIDSPDLFESGSDFPFYIRSNLILVGYDYGRSGVHTSCSPDTEEATNKYCHGKPCLCLHENTWWDDFDDDSSADGPIRECYEFNEDVIFLARFQPEKGIFSGAKKPESPNYYPEQLIYGDLFLYGDGCGTKSFAASKLYIEKFEDPKSGKIYIYIDEFTGSTKEILEKREKYMEDKYSREKICREIISSVDITSIQNYAESQIKKAEDRRIMPHEIPMDDLRTEEASIPIAKEFMDIYEISEGDAVNIVYGNPNLDMKSLRIEIESRKKADNTLKYPKKILLEDSEEKTNVLEICKEIGKNCFGFLSKESNRICSTLAIK